MANIPASRFSMSRFIARRTTYDEPLQYTAKLRAAKQSEEQDVFYFYKSLIRFLENTKTNPGGETMLQKGERSILAYFPSSINADKALQELQSAGIPIDDGSIAIDRVSRYNMGMDDEPNQPINNALTLSGPVLYSSSSPDEGPNPLLAASDSASGLGNPNAGAAGGAGFLLTVVTRDEKVQEAIQIIKENGGRV